MNQQQLELKAFLDANPTAWVNLTFEQQKLLRSTLRPAQGFSLDQEQLLLNRWLLVSQEQLESISNLLPPDVQVDSQVDINGQLWINANLLTDCMEKRDRYYSISFVLAQLPITLKDPLDFPEIDLE